jgi:tetratricopeptide (TPR) repeat protein
LVAESEKINGIESLETAIALKKLGRFYLSVNNFVKAAQSFENAMSLFSKIKGEIHDETINVAFFLSDAYYKNKQYKKAKNVAAYFLSV